MRLKEWLFLLQFLHFLKFFYFLFSGQGTWVGLCNKQKKRKCLSILWHQDLSPKKVVNINVICSAPPNTNVVWASPNGASAMPLPMWLIKFPVQSLFWVYCLLRRHTHFLWTFLSDKYGAKVRNKHFNEMKYFNRGIKYIYH